MKKILLIIALLSLFSLSNISYSAKITVISKEESEELKKEISREEAFNFFGDYFEGKIPNSYKYIELKFKDTRKGTKLYSSLQKLIYLDLIKNIKKSIKPAKTLNSYYFFKLSENIFGLNILSRENKKELFSKNTTKKDLESIANILNSKSSEFSFSSSVGKTDIESKKKIFLDVYKTILELHYDRNNIKQEDIIYSAIQGLAKGTGDKYTTYFPPVENKNFIESLDGQYEGIGAYVDMVRPGELRIISPIVGGPAEKAGIIGGDIVFSVDGVEVKENNSLKEVISWIKGPAGSEVELEVRRGSIILAIKVTREKIVINDIEYKLIDRETFYIQIKNFGPNVSEDFKKSLEELKTRRYIKKLVIDLRNNPGGYLGQVTDMLSYFVPIGKPTAIVKNESNSITSYDSKGYDLLDFSDYKIIILQNSGSASASEIMIGTIKDYYPETTLLGTKTYGKGSVQTIRSYVDGSTLKFTIAKWFTGKTQTGIDDIGIQPDIELEYDIEKYKENGTDNQLEKAFEIKK